MRRIESLVPADNRTLAVRLNYAGSLEGQKIRKRFWTGWQQALKLLKNVIAFSVLLP
jgi:hypothetical protein